MGAANKVACFSEATVVIFVRATFAQKKGGEKDVPVIVIGPPYLLALLYNYITDDAYAILLAELPLLLHYYHCPPGGGKGLPFAEVV